jgi:hypothetical protein
MVTVSVRVNEKQFELLLQNVQLDPTSVSHFAFRRSWNIMIHLNFYPLYISRLRLVRSLSKRHAATEDCCLQFVPPRRLLTQNLNRTRKLWLQVWNLRIPGLIAMASLVSYNRKPAAQTVSVDTAKHRRQPLKGVINSARLPRVLKKESSKALFSSFSP